MHNEPAGLRQEEFVPVTAEPREPLEKNLSRPHIESVKLHLLSNVRMNVTASHEVYTGSLTVLRASGKQLQRYLGKPADAWSKWSKVKDSAGLQNRSANKSAPGNNAPSPNAGKAD